MSKNSINRLRRQYSGFADFYEDVEEHLKREGFSLGSIVQRTILRRNVNGELVMVLALITVLSASDPPLEKLSDETEDFVLLREDLTPDLLGERLRALGAGQLKVCDHDVQMLSASFESDFHGSCSTYSTWPGRLFQVRGARVPFASGPLLGGKNFYLDAYDAIHKFLDIHPFSGDMDSRGGSVLLFIPSVRARFQSLQITDEEKLFLTTYLAIDNRCCKLHVATKQGVHNTDSFIVKPEGAMTVELKFRPDELRLFLYSDDFGILDKYEETAFYGSELWPSILRKAVLGPSAITVGPQVDHAPAPPAKLGPQLTYEVFLSFATCDQEQAETVRLRLTEQKVKVFFSPKDLKSGDPWEEVIRAALVGSREVCLIISKESIRREWVLTEWGAAWALQRRITPILTDCTIEDLPQRLRAKQCVRFEHIDRYVDDVLKRSKSLSVLPKRLG